MRISLWRCLACPTAGSGVGLFTPGIPSQNAGAALRFQINQLIVNGGWGEIRTPGTLTGTPHFECGAFNRSATHPSSLFRCVFSSGPNRQRNGGGEVARTLTETFSSGKRLLQIFFRLFSGAFFVGPAGAGVLHPPPRCGASSVFFHTGPSACRKLSPLTWWFLISTAR